MKFYTSTIEDYFDNEVTGVDNPKDAAACHAMDYATEPGECVYVAWDSYPNPEYDPDYGTSEDNPEFFLKHTATFLVVDEDGKVEAVKE